MKFSTPWKVDKSNYRNDFPNHKGIAYDKSTGRELVFGVLRPIPSYIIFAVKAPPVVGLSK